MRKFLGTACAGALAIVPLTAAAQSAAPLRPGMELAGTMEQSISSRSAYVGEPFEIDNVTSTDGYGRVTDAKIYGRVDAVTHAGQGRSAAVRLDFRRLVLPDGRTYALYARPEHIQVNTKNNAAKEAGGAIVGDLLGNYIGKVLGVGLLGPLGLVGGFLVAHNNRQPVVIPKNSLVTLRVLTARRQA